MKTKLQFILFVILIGKQHQIFAQSALNYTIQNATTGTLAADNAGNIINTGSASNLIINSTSNTTSTLQPIGFDFIFMGKFYSHFIVGTNGQVGLGISTSPANIVSNSAANDLTRTVGYPPTLFNNAPVLAPFWDKMTTPSTGATIRSVLVGTAPNRCRVMEWNVIINNTGANPVPSAVFQTRLYESSGKIEYVYGKMSVVSTSTTVNASIGFSAGTLDNQFLALQNLTGFPFTAVAANEPATQNLVNGSAPGDIVGLHSTADGARRYFSFTPPALNGTPLSGFQIIEIGATYVNLKWDDTYNNELGYTVLISSDNVNFTTAASLPANATGYAAGNLTLGNTYYFKVIANNEGASFTSNTLIAVTACLLNGTYTIGTGGSFASLSKAVDSIRFKGMTGNVVFEFLNNYNSSSEIFPISFPKPAQIPCFAGYKITVRPESGAANIVISAASNNPLFVLDSVNYLTVDGRPGSAGTISQLQILNNNLAPVFRLINASNNNFLYLKLGGGVSGISALEGVVNMQGSKATGCDHNKFAFCDLYSTTLLPDAKPVLLFSSAVSGFENNNDSILNCNFYNFSKEAINLTNFNDGWVIASNSFFNTGTLNYNNTVKVIKIDAIATNIPHKIEQNHFGGTAPNRQGNIMQVGYKFAYTGIDVIGSCRIQNNYFSRMRFFNDSISNNVQIKMIHLGDNFIPFSTSILNNEIGSSVAADSLHFFQGFTDQNTAVTGISVIAQFGYEISGNTITNLRCYSTNGWISLKAIACSGGGPRIRNNIIGNIGIPNSMINNSDGTTYGIFGVNTNPVINNNSISRITARGANYNASLIGIYINGGSVDSIYHNTIVHLINGNGAVANFPPLIGMQIYPTTPGGGGNMIEKNEIHSLVNDCTDGGGTVTGLQVGNNMNIRKNYIHHLSTNNLINNSSIYGILIPDKFSVLENNMVSLGLDSSGNSLTGGNLYIAGISGGEVMTHNSVYIGGTNVGDGFAGSAAFLFLGNALPTANNNNIFFNARSNASFSSSAKHQCINMDIAYSSNTNLYYFTGTGGIMGTFTGVRYNDFASWKIATGLDANSLFTNPGFSAAAAGSTTSNLHLVAGSPAEAAGGSGFTLSKDIDNESRNTLSPVDIGADAGNFGNCFFGTAGNNTNIFPGDSVQLGSTTDSNLQYNWSSIPVGFVSTLPKPFVSPTVTTLYHLYISNGFCTSHDSVLISIIQLQTSIICTGGSVMIPAINQGSNYQWQVDTGSGFVNIVNNTNYSGVNTGTLLLLNLPSAFYGYRYRCIVNGVPDIKIETIKFENNWTGAVNSLWSNPANWSCGSIPDGNTDVYISSGSVILDMNGICRTFHLAGGATFTVNTGFTLTITH